MAFKSAVLTTISKSALLPYSASQLFRLVDDIPSYPDFLPWCACAEERSRTPDEVNALLEISKGGFTKSFATCNRLTKDKMIEIHLIEGPFRYLQGFWRFDNLGEEGSKVSFELNFEFTNKLVGLTFGPIFNHIANNLVDAFCQRAEAIYGEKR